MIVHCSSRSERRKSYWTLTELNPGVISQSLTLSYLHAVDFSVDWVWLDSQLNTKSRSYFSSSLGMLICCQQKVKDILRWLNTSINAPEEIDFNCLLVYNECKVTLHITTLNIISSQFLMPFLMGASHRFLYIHISAVVVVSHRHHFGPDFEP